MKLKAFLALSVLSIALVTPSAIVFAQEVVISPTDISIEISIDENQEMIDELAQLKLKEKDASTGSFSRFLLKFKIRQLENQLNIKKALQENPA
jgi:hypothetical protein